MVPQIANFDLKMTSKRPQNVLKRPKIAIFKLGIVHVRLFGTVLQMSTNNYTIHLPNQTKCVYIVRKVGENVCIIIVIVVQLELQPYVGMTASLLVNFPPYVPYVLLQLFVLLLRRGMMICFFAQVLLVIALAL